MPVTHGLNRTPTHRAWEGMKTRCKAITHPKAKNYVGRGITYPAEWESFEQFLADMGLCPAGMTLDRKDNNKSYSKENCRWATVSEQNFNRRIPGNNKTGIKGVSLHAKSGRWQATSKLNGRSFNLYTGNDFFLACCARKSWENRNIPQGA